MTARAAGADAFDEHRDYICAETLALGLTLGAPPPDAVVQDARVDGRHVALGIERAP